MSQYGRKTVPANPAVHRPHAASRADADSAGRAAAGDAVADSAGGAIASNAGGATSGDAVTDNTGGATSGDAIADNAGDADVNGAFQDPHGTERDTPDPLSDLEICSATDCTGLIPALPASDSEITSYEQLYHFLPRPKA